MSDYLKRLDRISHRLRVALAAVCANRVLRIYELDYSKENCSPHASVDVAWKFACGAEITEKEFADTLEAAINATPNIEEEGDEYSGPMSASVSAICALKSIQDSTAKSASDTVTYALESIGSFEDHAGKGESSEENWQNRALELVESWGDQPITRGMFEVLEDEPPVWFPWPKR